MDRTFGKPRKSPINPVLLILPAYILGAGLLILPETLYCNGVSPITVSGIVMCLTVLVLSVTVVVLARRHLIWLVPAVFCVASYTLLSSGMWSYTTDLHGERACVIPWRIPFSRETSHN